MHTINLQVRHDEGTSSEFRVVSKNKVILHTFENIIELGLQASVTHCRTREEIRI